MPATALDRRWLFVPLFVVVQALLVHWVASGERPPAMPDLQRFPYRIDTWVKFREEPIDAEVAAQLGADRVLNWTYVRPGTSEVGNVFVAWFRSQLSGTTQPHSPQVCLPGAGWTFQKSQLVALNTGKQVISVNESIISLGRQRAALIYWYQTQHRVVASEWAAKYWVVKDALAERRTDTSLVRIVVWSNGQSDATTVESAKALARDTYLSLLEVLQH